MNLAKKVAYNTIIQGLSKLFSTVLTLFAVAMITRYLGQTGFGEYTTIFTWLSFFGIIIDFGLTLITVQMISKPGADENKILGNLLALRLVSAVVILGLAPIIILFFPYSQEVKLGVAIAAATFLFVALNQILVGLFQKHLRMDKVSIAEMTSRFCLVIMTVAAIKMDLGLYGILVAAVLANVVSFALHFLFSRQFVRIRLLFDFRYWLEILSRSWPLALTIFLNLIYLRADTLLLSLIKRPSEIGIIAEVGLYGAAYKVIDVLITLPFMFSGVVLPILTARWVAGDKDGFKNIMQRSFDALAIIGIPIFFGTQFIATPVMTLIAGSDFAISGPILQILIMAATIIFLGNIFAHAIIALDKQRRIIGAYLFTAASALLLYFLVIPKYSYFGAAWVTLYSELAIALASAWLVWKSSRFIPNLKIFNRSLLASLIMAGALYLLLISGYDNIILMLVSAGIVYFTALYGLGGLRKQDILELLAK